MVVTEIIEVLENILEYIVNLAVLLFEYVGVGVITITGIQGLINCLKRKSSTRLDLAKGFALGLEFKLGSEILRTVILRNLSELAVVAGIIALRAALTILIHWEIQTEEHDEEEREEKKEKKEKELESAKKQEAIT